MTGRYEGAAGPTSGLSSGDPRAYLAIAGGDGAAGSVGAASLTGISASAAALLAEGLPIDLTVCAASAYLERIQGVLTQCEGRDSLTVVKLLTAQTVAAVNIDVLVAAEPERRVREMAERLDSELATAYARVAWGFLHAGPENARARSEAAEFALAVSSSHGDELLVPAAYTLLLVARLERGEIQALDTALLERRTATPRSTAAGRPGQWFQLLRSILDGDTATAEVQVEALYAGDTGGETNALALYTTQLGMIRWMQGRIDGAESGFLAARREYPGQLIWASSLAWLWLAQGRVSAGEALLHSLPEPEDLPRDRYWLSTLVMYVEIARHTGSKARAQRLRNLLLPYANHMVAVGVGVAFWGTAARSLGLLEERLGDLVAARTHLELAVEMSRRIGALAWHAEAQIELAEFAIRHEIPDIAAYQLLSEARATSLARGFVGLARRAMHRPRLRVLGSFDVVSLCGVRAEWTSRKARELLKMLIAARGNATSREVYMEVLWPGETPSSLSNRFSVAVNVIRRALDPQRLLPTQHHVVTEGDSIRLELDHLDVDIERFFTFAKQPEDGSREAALRLYRGEAFSDELYADWATDIRDHARHVRATLGDAEPR